MDKKNYIKQSIKNTIEQKIIEDIKKIENGPFGLTPFKKDLIIETIVDRCVTFKYSLFDKKEKLKFSKEEIETLIEEISDKMVAVYVDEVVE